MKVYKVISMVVDYGYSLTPRLGGDVDPPTQTQMAGMPGYRQAWMMLEQAGYTEHQIMIIIQTWYMHGFHRMGLSTTDAMLAVRNTVEVYTATPAPPIVPPVVYYFVAVVAIVLIAKALIDPMEHYELVIQAPSTMYIFVTDEASWYGEVVAVSPGGRGLYEIGGEVGGAAMAHRKNVPYPPDALDQRWFLGTLLWEGWMFPYFRSYEHRFWWVQYLDIALHQNQRNYYLKHNAYDPFLPGAPYIRPGTQWGTPGYTGIYHGWWRNVVP